MGKVFSTGIQQKSPGKPNKAFLIIIIIPLFYFSNFGKLVGPLLSFFFHRKKETRQEKEELDPKLNNDVDVIYERVDKYLKIVRKTQCDMIPKAIKLYIIDELQNYIETELPSILIDSHGNLVRNT